MTKLTREQRRNVIIDAGVDLANINGLTSTKAPEVAERCEVPTSKHTVYSYFWKNEDLWREIARHPRASADVRKTAKALGL